MSDAYEDFLRAKVCAASQAGFDVPDAAVRPILKPHQRAIVRWMVAGGRRACFAAFGLGKSLIQLEAVRITREHAGGRALIVCPLGVRQEFARDAELVGTRTRFVRTTAEALAGDEATVYITNYESVREGKIDPLAFTVASLDEASCLRGFGGTKTFREFMRLFAGDDRSGTRTRGVPYRYAATATPSPNEFIELLAYSAYLDILDVSQAKAQPLDAKILTPSGWSTMGALRVGDQIVAGDGTITTVLGVYPQGERPIYRVSFSDGTATECDAEHLWLTRTQYERNNERRHIQSHPGSQRRYGQVRTTEEIAMTLRSRNNWNHSVPLCGPVQFTERPVSVDPWLLGVLIGDANLRSTSIVLSSADQFILDGVSAAIDRYGLILRRTTPHGCDYGLTLGAGRGGRGPGSNALLAALRGYDLLGKRAHEKRIPDDYVFNSPEVRLALLRGLMDTDGTVKGSTMSLTTTSPGLSRDVVGLVRSLGGTAAIHSKETWYTTNGKSERIQGRTAYRVSISLPGDLNPFSLPRKVAAYRPKTRWVPRRYITAVDFVGTKPAQCIAIDHDSRLYVTDDFLVTHNTRFFKRDSTKADSLTIHPHKEREFWLWVASWAIFVQRPSDLGYDDTGYDLPALDVRWHELPTDHSDAGHERDGQARMFRDAALGVVEASRERRRGMAARVAKAAEIVAEAPGEHFLIWHDLEDERRAIKEAIPEAVEVYGSQDLDEREQRIIDFSDGKIKHLATKPVLAGSGCNFQRFCHRAIFAGVGFKFNDFIQAIHRIQRFLQDKPVRIDLIYTEAERNVRRQLERKWAQHEELIAQMTKIIREFGLAHADLVRALGRAFGVDRVEVRGEHHTLVNNDCVLETRRMDENSVGLVLTSVPFSTQYEYSPNYSDFGHTDDNEHFFRQMDFLTPQLLRVLKPGRIAAIHVKDRIVPGGMTGLGFQTVYPFHARCIEHYTKHGFAYMGMKTIVTDVVRENNQTYRLGWTEQCKDGTKMGVGMPEYLLLFRKPPTDTSNSYADEPVVKSKAKYSRARWQTDAHGFARSSGDRPITAEDLTGIPHERIFKLFRQWGLTQVYDFEHHVKLGEALEARGVLPVTFMLLQPPSWHPDVWTDITRMLTLNGSQHAKGKEMHLCPMQIDLADRVIEQMSAPGDLVLDPFGGLMTVPYRAILKGRRGYGIELSSPYFLDGAAYCEAAERKLAMPGLFDAIEADEEPAA